MTAFVLPEVCPGCQGPLMERVHGSCWCPVCRRFAPLMPPRIYYANELPLPERKTRQ
jgi:uncharacterized Zn finger protein (UPF0148 family)